MMIRSLAATALAAVLMTHLAVPAAAQQNQDYFIPGQPKPPGATAPAPHPGPKPPQKPGPANPTPHVAPQIPTLGAGNGPPPLGAEPQEPPPQLNVQLPPPPDLPPLAKGEAPPIAVIGVMGVPEVMHASAAAQQVEKAIGERRAKLNDDAQKEQAVWREMQQALANDRAKLSAEQVRTRERELQDRITNAQRQFRERNRVIQEAAQYALAQIERTLIAVIRQVAEARGMNLVLHRAQVALNVNQFDITDQVADQLNKVLPSVLIPPDGVSPSALAQEAKPPITPASAKPASSPAGEPVPLPPPPAPARALAPAPAQ